MNYTLEDFRDICLQLLPAGPAWPRDSSSRLALLFQSMMSEFVTINDVIEQMKDEMTPVNSTMLFELWEHEYGLPDSCLEQAQTFNQRRAALIERHTYVGRQDKQFFIDFALKLGFSITIDEFSESSPGPAGTYVVPRDSGNLTQVTPVGEDWNFVWRINAESTSEQTRSYPSQYGESYKSVGTNEILECAIRNLVHAHRVLIFSYS